MTIHAPRRRTKATFGFTITELLVIIVTIAVIAALSMVGIGGIRDLAEKTPVIRSLSQFSRSPTRAILLTIAAIQHPMG